MEKKIEDYLHLYLGCEFYNLYYCKTEDDIKKEMSKAPKRLRYSDFTTHWGGTICGRDSEHLNKFRLILRPISDMTEEEKHLLKLNLFQYNKLDNPNAVLWEFDQVRILLKMHFDLFGLIAAGLAIDATKKL